LSYLSFMDDSGHDHKTMPYEVRGGTVREGEREPLLLFKIEQAIAS
jgi:hypothetical protein